MHSEHDLRRIVFVTRNFGPLRQGVSRAVVAPWMIVTGLTESYRSGPDGLVFGLVNIFGCVAAAMALWILSRRWMDRRFGRVRAGNPLYTICEISFLTVANTALSLIDDRYRTAPGHPSMQFLGIAVYGLWVCVRLWPYALHYTLPAAVALAFALREHVQGAEAFDDWFLTGATVTLLAWIAAGLIDLALLIKVLPDRRGAPVQTDVT